MKQIPSLRTLVFNLSRKILSSWVKTQIVGKDVKSLGIDPEKPVIYAFQLPSFAARLVVDQETIFQDLPRLQQRQKEGAFKEKEASFHLNRLVGWPLNKRSVPYTSKRLSRAIQAVAEDMSLDVQIVPVSVFWGRAPKKENSIVKLFFSDNWSASGRFTTFLRVLLNGRDTNIQFNNPVSLRQLVDEGLTQERTERKIARVLRVHFRQTKTSVLGPDLSHRRTMVERMVRSPAIKTAIQQEMEEKGISKDKAKKLALKYGDEISSNMSHSAIRFLDIILTWVWNKIYNGVEVNNIERLRDVSKDNGIIYTPCHRSHIDYLLLSYVLFKNSMAPPHIAAGINLNMPVVGPILRRGGAFFMRRTFKGNKLYASVFDEYMHTMCKSGFPIEYFVEGGRSRTGRTLSPKVGMVAMTLRSFLRDSRKPIAFMPVYTGYEKIFEGGSYLGELRGKSKKKESLLGVFSTLKGMKNSFGKVRVTFGDPIYLKEFLDEREPGWDEQNFADQDYKPEWFNKRVDELANMIVTRINSSTSINPINLLAMALLATPRQAMDEKNLAEQLDAYKSLLTALPYSEDVTIPEGSGQDWIDYAESMQMLHRNKHSMGDILTLDEANAVLLTYYRNNILHLFAVPSLLASLFINNTRLPREEVVRLCSTIYPYLKSELFIQFSEEELSTQIEKWLDIFIQRGYLQQTGDCIIPPPASSTDYIMLSVLSQSVIQTLERYYIAIALVQQHGSGQLDSKVLEEQCTLMAQRISILHGLNSPEFFDKALFRNLIKQLLQRDGLRQDEEGKLHIGDAVERIAKDANSLLNAQLRRSILQVTLNDTQPAIAAQA